MRVVHIHFRGFQRLVDTGCNTDGKMIAFVGPNEAGKTTVLRALRWFTDGGELTSLQVNKRANPQLDTAVVEVKYWIDDRDKETIGSVGASALPNYYIAERLRNGEYHDTLEPAVERDPAPFREAERLLDDAWPAEADGENPGGDDTYPWEERTAVVTALRQPDDAWEEALHTSFDAVINYLSVLEDPSAEQSVDALSHARSIMQRPHPTEIIREALRARMPVFAMFTDEDRAVRSAYDLADDGIRSDPPSALANLAWVADLDIEELWQASISGDTRTARTLERRANEALATRLGARWSQEKIAVEFNLSGTLLEVLVHELADDGADTGVEERSDGLRTFIALVAFLARHDFRSPPVLLVDEAETHLHYDAQADLIEVLTNDVQAAQVFYTTHSPGCLPRDLGTGVRFVAPHKSKPDESVLRNDFWTNSAPGFTPLLFAMGAGAAAFSAFRRAVLTEGAADMILLPSLIRLATGESELSYQVAPGIANHHGSGLALEEVAARVVYLLDGDEGGDEHRSRLEAMGIPGDRILQFERPMAAEDFVSPERYLEVVNQILAARGGTQQIDLHALDRSVSISKAVELWCDERETKAPGKPVVASQLVADRRKLKLKEGADAALAGVHQRIIEVLDGAL